MESRRTRDGVRRRRCIGCGFDGSALQGERGRFVFTCPSCEADLYARPPMSYAEMEGLSVEPCGWSSCCRRVLCWAVRALVREPGRAPSPISRRVYRTGDPLRRSSDVLG